jgi:hypothetical protein
MRFTPFFMIARYIRIRTQEQVEAQPKSASGGFESCPRNKRDFTSNLKNNKEFNGRTKKLRTGLDAKSSQSRFILDQRGIRTESAGRAPVKSRRSLAGFELVLSMSKDPAPVRCRRDFTSDLKNVKVFNGRTK